MKNILITSIYLLGFITFAEAKKNNHSTQEREKAAILGLKSSPDTVLVYAKGLVCESCAIGIRKKLTRLKFIDRSKPKKGIILDAKSQLVSISVAKGKFEDISDIKKAIQGAGYDPVTLYKYTEQNEFKVIQLKNY